MTLPPQPLPNLFVPGAQKAGTTFVRSLLETLPDVHVPEKLEQNVYHRPNLTVDAYLEHLADHWPPSSAAARWRLDKTPAYLWRVPEESRWIVDRPAIAPRIPERIHALCGPDVAIVVALRNPTRRAISAFFHHARRGRIGPDERLREAGQLNGVIHMGFYADHLRPWIEVFGGDRVLLLHQETDLRSAGDATRRLADFLGVDPPARAPSARRLRRNVGFDLEAKGPDTVGPVGRDGPVVTRGDVAWLDDVYAPSVRDLVALAVEIGAASPPAWLPTAFDDLVAPKPAPN